MRTKTSDESMEDLFWKLKSLDNEVERAALLDRIRKRQPAVAEALLLMLRNEQEAVGFMNLAEEPSDESSHGQSAPATPDAAISNLGDHSQDSRLEATYDSQPSVKPSARKQLGKFPKQIGPYKLLEPIGEGGMGIVYLAQQSKPVRRKVALKIIKPGMDSRQVIARFEAERQALAMMDHPHIAKVLDAGTTETGLPFFVMELVRGIPITDYCDQLRMPTRPRLELFRDTCEAIQHAHNKGIIHRDIKPSNVLVTEQDGKAVVKVIDFGVAKALTDNLTDKTLFTGMFQLMGTPLYMSPEQASISGVDVDVRSDVYSLGVMLYELLSGSLPVDREEVQNLSFEKLRERICETEPPKPSKRLSTLKDAARETVAERRGVNVSKLDRLVSNELDWIVMRSLEKDRSRRYQSAREFSEDLDRFISGDVVEACPPSTWYKLQKYCRRNRGLLTLAGTILLAAACVVAVSYWQSNKSKLAEKLAEEKAENLQVVLDFLVNDLLGSANPARSGDSAMSVTEALANGRATINNRFSDESIAGGTIRHTMALTYFQLGEYADSAELAQDAYRIRKRLFGSNSEQALASLSTLANSLRETGDPRCSELYGELVENYSNTNGDEDRETLAARMNLAVVSLGRQGNERAVAELRDIISVAEQRYGASDPFTLTAKANLVEGLYLQSEFDEASAIVSQVLETLGGIDQLTDLRLLNVMRTLAKLQIKVAKFAEAEVILRAVVRAQRNQLTASHPQLLSSIRQLADCLRQQPNREKFPELVTLCSEWETIASELYGEFSVSAWRARLFSIDAEWRLRVGAGESIDPVVEKLRDFVEQPAIRLPLDSGPRIEAMQLLAFVLNDKRKFTEAEELHREIVAACEQIYPEDHERILHARYDLAFVLMNAGKETESELLLRDNLPKQQQLLGVDHPRALATLEQLARVVYRQKKYPEAIELYEEAVDIRSNSPLHKDHPINLKTYNSLSKCYLVTKNHEKAIDCLGIVVEQMPTRTSVTFSQSMLNLVVILGKEGRYEEQKEWIRKYLPASDLETIKQQALNANNSQYSDYNQELLGKTLAVAAWNFSLRDGISGEDLKLATLYGKTGTELWDSHTAFNNYGVALYRDGQFAESVRMLEKADAMIEGGDRPHRMFLAMAHWRLGNKAKAREYFDQGIAWQEEQEELPEEQTRFRGMAEELMGIESD